MSIEQKLKSRFGEPKNDKSSDFFGADIEISIHRDSKTSETKIINFRDEILKIKNQYPEPQKTETPEITLTKKKRKKKIKKNMGVSDDSDDNFIDDSEAYEAFIPNEWTTSIGGFYINKGPLKFIKNEKEKVENDEKKKKIDSPKKENILSQASNLNDASLDPEVKNFVDSRPTNMNVSSEFDDPKFKSYYFKFSELIINMNHKDRLCALRYMVTQLGITLNTGRKLLKISDLCFLNSKIDDLIKQLKDEISINRTRFNEHNELIKYLVNKPIIDEIYKTMKRINTITDARDSNEKIVTDLVNNKLKIIFDPFINSENFFKILESKLLKCKKNKIENTSSQKTEKKSSDESKLNETKKPVTADNKFSTNSIISQSISPPKNSSPVNPQIKSTQIQANNLSHAHNLNKPLPKITDARFITPTKAEINPKTTPISGQKPPNPKGLNYPQLSNSQIPINPNLYNHIIINNAAINNPPRTQYLNLAYPYLKSNQIPRVTSPSMPAKPQIVRTVPSSYIPSPTSTPFPSHNTRPPLSQPVNPIRSTITQNNSQTVRQTAQPYQPQRVQTTSNIRPKTTPALPPSRFISTQSSATMVPINNSPFANILNTSFDNDSMDKSSQNQSKKD